MKVVLLAATGRAGDSTGLIPNRQHVIARKE